MTLNPMLLLAKEVACQYPKIADWEQAVGAFMDGCLLKGVVDPERPTCVRALLSGYLLVGRERRQHAESDNS